MLQNTKGKGKVLTTRERKSSVYRGIAVKQTASFPRGMASDKRQWDDVSKYAERK